MSKQTITVILARINYDPTTCLVEHKSVDIEVDDDGCGQWHVMGEAYEEGKNEQD